MAEDTPFGKWAKRVAEKPGGLCFQEKTVIAFPRLCDKCDEAIKGIRDTMNEVFKGSTEWNGDGCWYDEDNKVLVCESVTVIEAAHKCVDDPEDSRKLVNTIKKAMDNAKQSAFYIEHAGERYLMGAEGILKSRVR